MLSTLDAVISSSNLLDIDTKDLLLTSHSYTFYLLRLPEPQSESASTSAEHDSNAQTRDSDILMTVNVVMDASECRCPLRHLPLG